MARRRSVSGEAQLSCSGGLTAVLGANATRVMRRYVASGPLVRSSYRAGEFFMEAMIKGDRQRVPQLV